MLLSGVPVGSIFKYVGPHAVTGINYCVSRVDGTIQAMSLIYKDSETPSIGHKDSNSKCKKINAKDDCIGSVIMHEHDGIVQLIEFSYRRSGYFFKVGNWTEQWIGMGTFNVTRN